MRLFLRTPFFHALHADIQVLQQRGIFLRLAKGLDERLRQSDIRDRRNGAARRAERVAQIVLRKGEGQKRLRGSRDKALCSA